MMFIGVVALALGIYGFLLVVTYCWIFSMICLCLVGGVEFVFIVAC